MKILSPAGNMESLTAAVKHGADEVYLGINDFNARNNIDGFTLENLKQAVDFAHIHDVKVLLAINILFSNAELQQALNTVVRAYNDGVDAFIVQDLGLIKLINDNYPQVELHASTQMGIHNLEGVLAIKKYGIKRVVLSRETPLEEIKRIKDNCDIEIEYFVQGALCVSFSGNCYLSSYLNDASGNRGKCKQFCRLPYTFMHKGKAMKKGYLLSAKDFNMIKRLDDLKNVGVDVLKIEGRARRPFYVGMITSEYRKVVDGLKYNQENIMLAFNRNYTEGYFNGNGKIISNIQSHIGLNIGKVISVKGGKTFNEVFITSNRTLSPKSTFKFFGGNKEICTLTAHDLKEIKIGEYRITTTQRVFVGNTVNLIIDYSLEKKVLSETKKVGVKIDIAAVANSQITATAYVKDDILTVLGDVCLPAEKSPISTADLNDCFAKSDIFYPIFEGLALENAFLPKSRLNDFRRNVYKKVYDLLTENKRVKLDEIKIEIASSTKKFTDFEIVDKINVDFTAKNVIYSPEIYEFDNICAFKNKCKKFGKKPYLDMPNFALEEDILFLKNIIESSKISIVVNNYYALNFDTEMIMGGGLNVYNSIAASELGKPYISAETSGETVTKFPYMTLRHCPLKSHDASDCKNCSYDNNYAYTMESGKTLKLKRKKLSTCTFYLVD